MTRKPVAKRIISPTLNMNGSPGTMMDLIAVTCARLDEEVESRPDGLTTKEITATIEEVWGNHPRATRDDALMAAGAIHYNIMKREALARMGIDTSSTVLID